MRQELCTAIIVWLLEERGKPMANKNMTVPYTFVKQW